LTKTLTVIVKPLKLFDRGQREINFEIYVRLAIWITEVCMTNRQIDRRTDRRTNRHSPLYIASRGDYFYSLKAVHSLVH